METMDLVRVMRKKIKDLKPIAPREVKDGLFTENVWEEKDVDVLSFPAPRYNIGDGGRYIGTGHLTITRDPEEGWLNIGTYRVMVHDGKSLGLYISPGRHARIQMEKYFAQNRPMPVALSLGHDPLLFMASAFEVPYGLSEYDFAGGLKGEPIEVVKLARTGLQVPATAEVVIEFEVDMNKTVMEGPLGEYTGYYTPASLKPVGRVTAITHRKGAIFQGLLTGKPVTENHILKQIPFEASFLKALKRQFPTIEDVSVRASAGVSFYVVISMQPRFAGEARQVILAAMASNIRPKWTIIVEPDIDVHSSAEVEWALAFRTQPQQDTIIVEQIPSGPSDPSIDEPTKPRPLRTASCIGIDATRPFGKPFSEVADVPGWEDFAVPELDEWR